MPAQSPQPPPGRQGPAPSQPAWWTEEHTAAWERDRARIRTTLLPIPTPKLPGADWIEPFRGALSASVLRLAESETARSTAGAAPTTEDWRLLEPAMRFGHGAFGHFHSEGTTFEQVEPRLAADWTATGDQRSWREVRDQVRQGWDWARRHR